MANLLYRLFWALSDSGDVVHDGRFSAFHLGEFRPSRDGIENAAVGVAFRDDLADQFPALDSPKPDLKMRPRQTENMSGAADPESTL